jgi:hypothetical protein
MSDVRRDQILLHVCEAESGAISLFWSVSVLAEVMVFLMIGPWLIATIGPERCAYLSADAGVLRWGVMGMTTWARRRSTV